MRSVFFGGGSEDQPQSDFVIPTPLSAQELRVLGCLLEKQFLTPDIYPLSLNAIVTACNQKTSRDPVTAYDDDLVEETLDSLQHKGLAGRITGPDHRVPKYREFLIAKTSLRVSEVAVLCVMMLRGPQSPGELKERTNRIHEFADNDDVESTLEKLINREPQVLAVHIPKQPGQRDSRYMHLLAGPVDVESVASAAAVPAPREDRASRLEAEVADLRTRVAELERQLESFRKQFE